MASDFARAARAIGIGTLAAVAARAAFEVADDVGEALGGPRSKPLPNLGGLSLRDAQKNADKALRQRFARRNFFNVTVQKHADSEGVKAFPAFSFLAVEASYTDHQLTGEKRRVGAAQADSLQSREAVELQLITYDTADGQIKRLLRGMSASAVNQDGTVGVPFDYALIITLEHAFAKADSVEPNQAGATARKSHIDRYLMRLALADYGGLSRRDNGLQELNLTFQQLDTFMDID